MKKNIQGSAAAKERKKILERINKISLPYEHLESVSGERLRIGDIIYFESFGGKTVCFCDDGESGRLSNRPYEVGESINQLTKALKGVFIRTHRSYLVAIDRVRGSTRRFGDKEPEEVFQQERDVFDEGTLFLRKSGRLANNSYDKIPISETYAARIRKAFGIKNLHYFAPEHSDDKKMRAMGLIDFGWRDLYKLDINDQAAVEDFQKKWDIKKFSKTRMLANFRRVASNEIDKRRVIKNIVWQIFRWIKKGIEPLSDGNIRSLWYRIKSVLAYHSNIFGASDVDTFYDSLQEMVEDYRLFRYKDFGFMDMNEPYRGIGETRPEIILASEKIGHFFFIKKLAAKVGASFICLKGEPATISIEYFSDDLKAAAGDEKKIVLCVTDVDPAGYSIESNLVEGLENQGHEIKRVVKLVEPGIFTDEEVEILRYPVVKFNVSGGKIEPIQPTNMSQVTKARKWFEEDLKDSRFRSERMIGRKKQVTIWGVESDAADRSLIEERIFKEIGKAKSS